MSGVQGPATNAYAATTHASPHWIVRYPHRKRFALAAEAIDPRPDLRLLDYGTGDGYLVAAIAAACPGVRMEVVGYEPVPKYAELFRQSVDEPSLDVSLITTLNGLEAGSFDVIACMSVLEHMPLPERQRFYEECERLLKPRGRIVIEVPVELGPSVLVKDVGRKLLKGRPFENGLRQLVGLALGRRLFDPARYDPASVSSWIQGHEGFDYRLFGQELARRFRVRRTFGAPLRLLPPWLGNQEAFFVCEVRSPDERDELRSRETSSTPA